MVCSHGFELLSRSLTPEDQNMIRGLYFRDLIISLSGKEVCGKLIQALISDHFLEEHHPLKLNMEPIQEVRVIRDFRLTVCA